MFVYIGNIIFFSSVDVLLMPGSMDVTPKELYAAVELAYFHSGDSFLLASHYSDESWRKRWWRTKESNVETQKLSIEDYQFRLKEFNQENAVLAATKDAKLFHSSARRREFKSSRSHILLSMIEAGAPYTCAQAGCTQHDNLTIDHIVPLSRGGTDELINLRFLCVSHNSAKRDRNLGTL